MNIAERARQYMDMYEKTLSPMDVPETPEAAIDLAGKFAVPDNTQFYRDELSGLAAKRAEALKSNRWLALAQFGAGIADGRPNSLGTAAQSGLAALRSANMEDKAGKQAELESRLKLAGMDQARTAAQMNNAREMYTSGLAAKRAAKEKALGLGIDMAQSDRSNALGYAQLSQGDLSRKFYDLMKIPGMTEAQAKNLIMGTSKNKETAWYQSTIGFLRGFDPTKATPKEKEFAAARQAEINDYLTQGILPAGLANDFDGGPMVPGLLPNVNSGVDLPIPPSGNPPKPNGQSAAVSPAAVAQQAAGLNMVAEMANKGDLLINKAGSYQNAKAEIAKMQLPQRDKVELLTALEAAKNRRVAMAGTRAQ